MPGHKAHALIGDLLQDLRYGVRGLAKSPGFAGVSILTLALGIGANTAVFSLIDALILKNLPVRNPEEIAMVAAFHGDEGRHFSYPMFRDISARQKMFSGLYASGSAEFVRVRVDGLGEMTNAERIQGRFVSPNYFSILGIEPVFGRVFDDQHVEQAVISCGFWQRHLRKDASVLGRVITLNQASFVIIGIAPREFFGESPGAATDLWISIEQPRIERRDLLEVRTATWFRTMARLKPGIRVQQAEAPLTALYRQLLADEIASGTGSLIHKAPRLQETRVALLPGGQGVSWHREQLSQPLSVSMLVVGVVLLIACANVANLLLARASVRQREIGIRLALGAGRLRLLRQLLTESLLLAVLAGITGFGLFFATRGTLLTLASVQIDLRPDWRVIGFAAAVATLTAVLFGLVPALQATKLRVIPSAQPARACRSRSLLPRLLVVSQMALGIVLKGTLLLSVGGVALGLPVAIVASRLVEHFLFGVRPTDSATMGLAVGLLLLMSLLASYLPARRASRIDPAVALRQE